MDELQTKHVVAELLQQNLTTIEYYFEIHEELSGQREEIHQWIIHEILTRKKYSKSKYIYMLGGAPANGKSTFLKSKSLIYHDTALKIDPDEIKNMLPEYPMMLSMNEPLAAVLVHEESSWIAKQVRKAAIEKGYDLILDGIANESFDKRKEDIAELKSNGHFIRIDYVSLETSLSLRLSEIRFQQTGRKVPDEYVLDKNKMIALLIPQLIENNLFDELYLWDTNQENNPRLILSQKNGKLDIENEWLYEDFKKKAND